MLFSNTTTLTLEEIIEGCRRGDVIMQKALYDRYSGRFYMLCRRYTADECSAQEVLSDGFLQVFRNIDKYRGEGSFEGWMYTIFLRCATKKHRHESRCVEVDRDADVEMTAVRDRETDFDLREALLRSMRKLCDEERHVFNLVAVEGYKLKEAAEMLKVNLSTLKSRYYKSLQRMKTMMEKYMSGE